MSCLICFDNYSNAKIPLSLGCGHCMCYVCYSEYYKKFKSRVTCPECLHPITKAPDALPINTDALVEGRGLTASTTLTAAGPNPLTQIVVIDLNGRRQKYSVNASETVLRLKNKIKVVTGTDVELLSLIYAGKVMTNDETLGSLNVQDKSTIHLTQRNEGGNQSQLN